MQDKPKKINLTPAAAGLLKERVLAVQELSAADRDILVGLISFNFWLQQQLLTAKLTITRLKRLFGFSTEKKTPKNHRRN
jgi:hypothetical protein